RLLLTCQPARRAILAARRQPQRGRSVENRRSQALPTLSGPLAALTGITRLGLPPASPSCCDRIGRGGLTPPLEYTAPHGALNGGRKLTPFRLKIDPLGVHSSVVDPGTRPRSRSLMRYESPLSAITSAWWTRRSIMAAATTSSPNTSPQRPNGLFEVTIRLARS